MWDLQGSQYVQYNTDDESVCLIVT